MLKSILFLAATGAALQPAPAPTQALDVGQLTELNARWLKSYETRDRAALETVLAEDFIGLYGDTILTRQQIVEGLATRAPTRVKWDKLRINVRGDTAIVDGISTITTIRASGEASAKYHYVDIYSRRSQRWRAVASHVVRLPD